MSDQEIADEYGELDFAQCSDQGKATFHHREDSLGVEQLIGDEAHFACPTDAACVIEVRTYGEFARLSGRGFWASTEY